MTHPRAGDKRALMAGLLQKVGLMLELSPDLVVADRFRLVRPLGHGGMGAVWLAHHIRLETACAVKFMHPEVAREPAFRARFDREAIAAAQLRSPHVVQVLDHGVWEEAPYIAMEYLEGEDLEHRLRRKKRLSPAETAGIVSQVARALTRAHAAELVHRDLKPANIFLVRDDDREIVKVVDFGIAKSNAPKLGGQTRTGAIVGTAYYMSPEQAQGTRAVDHRTDLWALGVVAYECLTGELPFSSEAFGDLVLKIIVDPLPVPSQIAAVPPGFDAWWARAVDRDPARRFQSAREMADALEDALAVPSAAGVGSRVEPSQHEIEAPPDEPSRAPTPVEKATEVLPRIATTAGTMAASIAGAPARRERSWGLAAGAVVAALIGAAAVFALRGHGDPVSAASNPPPSARVETAVAPPASEPTPPIASATPPAEPSAAPLASAIASADAAVPAPTASAAVKPAGALKPARPAASAQPQGRDLGF